MARKTTITGDGIRDDSITGDDVDESTLILDTLRDVDGDTKIQIEESADEDKIRFDTAGVERLVINSDGGIAFGNTSAAGAPASWNFFNFKGGGVRVTAHNFYADNDRGLLWGDSSVSVKGNASVGVESLTVRANYNAYIHVDGVNDAVGIGTTTPASTLSVDGSISAGVTLINTGNDPGTTYSVVDTDYVILVNTRPTPQGGIDSSLTITLPLAASYPGRIIVVKDSGGYSNINNITISRAGSDTIEGVNTTLVLNNIAQFTRLISNGVSNWCEIGS